MNTKAFTVLARWTDMTAFAHEVPYQIFHVYNAEDQRDASGRVMKWIKTDLLDVKKGWLIQIAEIREGHSIVMDYERDEFRDFKYHNIKVYYELEGGGFKQAWVLQGHLPSY